jgi:hypothetical protein
MAARKKTARKKPAPRKKPSSRSRSAQGPARAPRKLPNDDAWRELVETAVAKPDPASQNIGATRAPRPRKAAKKK